MWLLTILFCVKSKTIKHGFETILQFLPEIASHPYLDKPMKDVIKPISGQITEVHNSKPILNKIERPFGIFLYKLTYKF